MKKLKSALFIKMMVLIVIITVALPVLPVGAYEVSNLGTNILEGQVTGKDNQLLTGVNVTVYQNDTIASTGVTGGGSYTIPALNSVVSVVYFQDPTNYYTDLVSSRSINVGNTIMDVQLFPILRIYNSFHDSNSAAGQVSGTFTWNHDSSDTRTLSYNVYLLTESGNVVSKLADQLPLATTTYPVSNLTSVDNRIGVQAVFANGILGPIVSTPLWDNGTPIAYNSYAFYDTNQTPDVIDASIVWNPASDEAKITKYLLHTNYNAQRILVAQITKSSTSVTSYTYTIPGFNINYNNLDLSVVNTSGEESPAFSISVVDNTYDKVNLSSVPNAALNAARDLYFGDTDQATGFIGGTVNFNSPAAATSITGYEAYFLDSSGDKIASIASLKAYSNTSYKLTIKKNTPLLIGNRIAKKIAIYAKDSAGKVSLPVVTDILDNLGSYPRDVSFMDTNQVSGIISGTLYWSRAMDDSDITGYKIYLADDNNNLLGSPLNNGNLYVKDTNVYSYQVPLLNQSILINNIAATHIAVVSVKANNDIDKLESIPIWDNITTTFIYGLQIYDNNASPGIIDATISWNLYGNEAIFSEYVIFYIDSANVKHIVGRAPKHPGNTAYSFSLTTQLYNSLPSHTGILQVGYLNSRDEFAPQFWYVTISDNTSGASFISPPTATLPQAQNLYFDDFDSAAGSIGGQLSWKKQSGDTVTVGYSVYLVDSALQKYKPLATLSNTPYESISLIIPNGTLLPTVNNKPIDTIGIYAINAAGLESSNPVYISIWDYYSGFFDTHTLHTKFIDTNPIENAISAEIHWDHFSHESNISQYTLSYSDNNYVSHIIATINKSMDAEYVYTLSNTAVPSYVKEITLSFNDINGFSVPIEYLIRFSDSTTAKPTLSADINLNLQAPASLFTNAFNTDNLSSAEISWSNPFDSSAISDYEVYYLDKAGQKVGSLVKTKKANYYNRVNVPLTFSNIPATAVKLGVFSKDSNGKESKAYAAIPLFFRAHAAMKVGINKVNIADVMNFIKTDEVYTKESYKFLLDQIDPVSEVNN